MREHLGMRHTVTVAPDGFVWQDRTYPSLSAVARAITGTWAPFLRPADEAESRWGGGRPMTHAPRKLLRCAVYTRKSTEHNLDLEFNSLDAQRETCEAYIKSQAHEGWRPVRTRYDDGGLSGGTPLFDVLSD
jgi:Protein of unknown function (DUF2924)